MSMFDEAGLVLGVNGKLAKLRKCRKQKRIPGETVKRNKNYYEARVKAITKKFPMDQEASYGRDLVLETGEIITYRKPWWTIDIVDALPSDVVAMNHLQVMQILRQLQKLRKMEVAHEVARKGRR